MLLTESPKVFIIVLENNLHSQTMYNECLETAKKYNWQLEQFNAFDGHSIEDSTWKDLNLKLPNDKKFLRRKGVHGCFLSHYTLWKKSLETNESIIILEHDTLIQDYWKTVNFNCDVLKLHTSKKYNYDVYCNKWSVGAQAYIISPTGAKKIIDWVHHNFAYHADMLIGDKIVNWQELNYDLVKLNPMNFSTTNEKRSEKLKSCIL